MLPRPSRLKSLASELSPVLTTPPPVDPNTVLVLMSVPEMMLSSNFVVLRRRAAMQECDAGEDDERAAADGPRRRVREELVEETRRLLGRRSSEPPWAGGAFGRLDLGAARGGLGVGSAFGGLPRPCICRASLCRGLRHLLRLRSAAAFASAAAFGVSRPSARGFDPAARRGVRRRRCRSRCRAVGAAPAGALPFAARLVCNCAIVWFLSSIARCRSFSVFSRSAMRLCASLSARRAKRWFPRQRSFAALPASFDTCS